MTLMGTVQLQLNLLNQIGRLGLHCICVGGCGRSNPFSLYLNLYVFHLCPIATRLYPNFSGLLTNEYSEYGSKLALRFWGTQGED